MSGMAQAERTECTAKVPWPRKLGSLLFFLMLFVPTTYQTLKLALLAVCLIALMVRRPAIVFNARLATGTLIVVLFGAFLVFYGAILNAPGAIPNATVFVLWPLVFFVLASGITSENHLRSLVRTMIWAAIGIGAYGCLMVLALTGRAPAWAAFKWLDLGQGIYFEHGVVATTLNSLTSLLFLVPFMVTILVTWPRDRPWPVSPRLIYLALALDTALTLLSGRRALLLAILISPILAVLAAMLMRARKGRWVFPLVALTALAVGAVLILNINVGLTVDYLSSGATKIQSNNARSAQFGQLIAGWHSHPLMGSGLGAVAEGPVRSIDMPWAYELTYVALLFQIGLIGVAVYFIVLLRLSRKLVMVARTQPFWRPWAVPMFVGFLAFLVSNATNPYLLKFDSMYVLFLPVALINVSLAVAAASHADEQPPTRASYRKDQH